MQELTKTQMVTFEDFCQAAAQRLQVDANMLQPSAFWVKDIGITSVDIVKIALLIRQKFGIKVPTSKVGKIKTVHDAYMLLSSEASHE